MHIVTVYIYCVNIRLSFLFSLFFAIYSYEEHSAYIFLLANNSIVLFKIPLGAWADWLIQA